MGNEDEFNMYDDLDELLIEPSSKKEQKLIEEETKKKILAENEKIEKLKEQINSLQVELAEVTKSRNQLHENMNKLLKTSITEIQR
jgi:phosphoribosylaminoimidazole-succinocarboxamide synthase